MGRSWVVFVCVGVLAACGGEVVGGSDGGRDAAGSPCTVDGDCSDGRYCTGEERCDASSPEADARGCVAAEPPCPATSCDESTRSCDGCPDADGDGHADLSCGGDDCDDANPERFPGNVEICDADDVDEDCDATTLGHDRDADGSVDAACCNPQMDGSLACGDDCDDTRSFVNPGASEICNGADDDCDGSIDEGVDAVLCRDADTDLFGDPDDTVMGCPGLVEGYVSSCNDCDDANAAANPGAPEVCNGVDDNCNGATDEGVEATLCLDMDGDLYGDPGVSMRGCPGLVSGYVMSCTDCDDGDAAIRPGAAELCDGADNDCNTLVDDGVMLRPFYRDCDGDTYGDASATPVMSCGPTDPPVGCASGSAATWATRGMDCDDGRAGVYPGAPERCNGRDNDCDGITDNTTVANAWCNDPSRLGPNVSSNVCRSGSCAIATCISPYLDCSLTSGCETNGRSDLTNCGACGNRCGGCVNSVCLSDTLAPGWIHSCARRATGSVACWGANFSGQLGDGTRTNRRTPVMVSGLTDALEVASGSNHSCARLASGVIRCWGGNSRGQLGDGTTSPAYRLTPVPVPGITDAIDIAAGGDNTCALRATGRVLCWGDNQSGQVGDGSGASYQATPVVVTGITDAIQITIGESPGGAEGTHACALRAAGTVVCWGKGSGGRLGDGSVMDRPAPVMVSGLSDSVEITAGGGHTCARRSSGAVVCWGINTFGALGDGTITSRSTPTVVSGLSNAVEIGAGSGHTCARRATGSIACWGRNYEGQLGNGSTTNRSTPVTVSGLSDAVEVALGFWHTCARRATGAVLCWGANWQGQLGDGTTTDRSTPVVVSGL